MKTTAFDVNVSRPEAIRRYLLSAGLIGTVLLAPASIPSWFALVACYPAFTALIQWDPINAMSQSLVNHLSKSVKNALFREPAAI